MLFPPLASVPPNNPRSWIVHRSETEEKEMKTASEHDLSTLCQQRPPPWSQKQSTSVASTRSHVLFLLLWRALRYPALYSSIGVEDVRVVRRSAGMRVRAKNATESAPFSRVWVLVLVKITVLCRFGSWKFALKKNVMFVKSSGENLGNYTEFRIYVGIEIRDRTHNSRHQNCDNNCLVGGGHYGHRLPLQMLFRKPT